MANQPGSNAPTGQELIKYLLEKLARFTGPDWEQEDDVTFVTLHRFPH
jgi:serine phosphatase RsbU (regulator of sigma subunit)